MAETAYTDKQGNEVSLSELLKGKNQEQIKAIKFFNGIPIEEGCFKKKYLTAEAYMAIVKSKLGQTDLKNRALQKLGLDEDQVKEIEPVCFEGFREGHSKINPLVAKVGNDYFSSMYEVTWLFFGDDQVYVYNHAFDTTDDSLIDTTQEYFYKDITAFATNSDSIQKKVWIVKSEGCSSSSRESEMAMVSSELFRIVVPGEVFQCAYQDEGSASQKISAMKQKLREKKQQH
jgi:hypothetical protein